MQPRALIKIIRPLNCLMAAFGVFIGYSIALGSIAFNAELGIAMLVAFLVCAAGIAINDFFDAKIDEKLHPNKPIPNKRISPQAVLYYSNFLFVLANLMALYHLPAISFAIAFAFTILLIIYSRFLTKAKFIGNWIVASGTAFTLIFGASLLGNYNIVALFAISALLANVAREIMKDIEDIRHDRGFKVSLPMIAGIAASRYAVFACTLAAIVLGYMPWALFGFGNAAFLVLLGAANIGFLYSLKLVAAQNYGKAQRLSKAAMLLALLAFLAGVL